MAEEEEKKGGRFGTPTKKKKTDKFSPERKAAAEKHAASAPVQQRRQPNPTGQGNAAEEAVVAEKKVKTKPVNYRLKTDLLNDLELLNFISGKPMSHYVETGVSEVVEREIIKLKAQHGDKFDEFKSLFELQRKR